MGFSVLAHHALALLAALCACAEAVAVVFAAARFLAGALALRDPGRHALEGAGMPEVGYLLRLVDLQAAMLLIAAEVALAALVAKPALGEALAVHFEAVDFAALAALELLARGEVELRDGAQEVAVVRGVCALVYE